MQPRRLEPVIEVSRVNEAVFDKVTLFRSSPAVQHLAPPENTLFKIRAALAPP